MVTDGVKKSLPTEEFIQAGLFSFLFMNLLITQLVFHVKKSQSRTVCKISP